MKIVQVILSGGLFFLITGGVVQALLGQHSQFEGEVNLAVQAGVRYSND